MNAPEMDWDKFSAIIENFPILSNSSYKCSAFKPPKSVPIAILSVEPEISLALLKFSIYS